MGIAVTCKGTGETGHKHRVFDTNGIRHKVKVIFFLFIHENNFTLVNVYVDLVVFTCISGTS